MTTATATLARTTATPARVIDVTEASAAPVNTHGFTRRANGDLMDAHRQWATRPADEAVYSVDELLERTRAVRAESATTRLPWADLRVEADGDRLAVLGRTGVPAYLGHWSMGQLATAASAPAGYMVRLPASLAADCISHGLRTATDTPDADAQLLLRRRDDGTFDLRGVATTKYQRVWDMTIAEHVARLCERGTWGPAQAFRTADAERVAHAWGEAKPLPLGWVGDRSSFVCLVDYEGAVEVRGSRMARFLMIQNSEVRGTSLKITFGLLDFACANFILWGCEEVHEKSFAHVGQIQAKVAGIFAPARQALSSGARERIVGGIAAAQTRLLGDTQARVVQSTRAITGLSQVLVEDAYSRAAATPRYGSPATVWGMLSGLTEASQHSAAHADDRLAIDSAAAKLMRFAK